ncbi:Vicilin-like seed storage protein [Thalictrum thalictroides]|uniref:Vicilin-like seed storage protein n=1 Tax=Thalictrum thalictroides TaxID=46969 RepID=A0A7J6WVA5_THATH|nr:Vicilin-like seed storage protein [Thalictrum thalictroides]
MKSGSKLLAFFFFFLFFFSSFHIVAFGYKGKGGYEGAGDEGYDEGQGGGQEEKQADKEKIFVLPRSKQVMRSEAGEFRVVRGYISKGYVNQSPMHIGFINMEPKSLFLPQYLDSSLIIFVRRGKAKIGWINKESLVETNLKIGDVYRIPAGSSFYIVNTGEGQILQMICSIDTSESLQMGVFQSFFIGGGMSPVSILSGFDETTLTAAFNVSSGELEAFLTGQQGGPMVFVNGTHDERILASFMQLKHQERLNDMEDEDEENNEEEQDSWTWRKLLGFVFSENASKKEKKKSSDAINLYDRKPDFENKHGSSRALTYDDYEPLRHSDIGVYLVNLTAGAMMAPHINPMATEYGVVLRGSGKIQVVYPNGSSAMKATVNEGDVFWVPRYFPFCQIASRRGPFEFFGFSTSARDNRPQFLVGASSILQTMKGPEFARAFGVNESSYDKLINAQKQSIILPSTPASPPKLLPDEPQQEEEQEQQKEEDRDHQHQHKGYQGGSIIELWE